MKKIEKANSYCKSTGFPLYAMKQLLHSKLSRAFAFRVTPGKTAPWYIDVGQFEKMLERGDFKEVLEG